jgi:RNA ligase (TIGR02306 family)
MSTFTCPIVRVNNIVKHPNADTLSMATVEGCPVIFGTEMFKEGDLAIYVPVDAVVPETVPGTEFLGKHRRIKAKKLRGIFSMGLLLPHTTRYKKMDSYGHNDARWLSALSHYVGLDLADELEITKYEEPEPTFMQTGNCSAPKTVSPPPVYDMESFRKYHYLFEPGEEVYVSEKIHGTNARFVYWDGQLYCGSHKTWKTQDDNNLWWKVAKAYNLEERLKRDPGMILYGEIYGNVQDLKYGAKLNELFFRAFDVYHTGVGQWLSYLPFVCFCDELELPRVPTLYKGPYTDFDALAPFAEGQSTLADNVKEGFVIKPTMERWDAKIGRMIAKLISPEYLLRKGGTEHH